MEEEAAQAMGLNLSLHGGSEEEPVMLELDLEPEEATHAIALLQAGTVARAM